MRRREFVTLVGGTAAWPLVALAQQQAGKLPRIGGITTEPSELGEALSQGLREAGYVDGQNIILDMRYHHGSLERIDEFGRELVALKCSIIVAGGPPAIRAVLKETNTIPTVGIDLESDPVANGWVKSLARPGGHLTGLFLDIPELGGKQIELLKNVVPTLTRLAALWDSTIGTLQFHAIETAARSSGVTLESFPIRTAEEINDAVNRAAQKQPTRYVGPTAQNAQVLWQPIILSAQGSMDRRSLVY